MANSASGLAERDYEQKLSRAGFEAVALEPEARATLIGTAIIIFVFRAVPTPGEGLSWWFIDELKFDADGRILPVVITKDGVAPDPIRKD